MVEGSAVRTVPVDGPPRAGWPIRLNGIGRRREGTAVLDDIHLELPAGMIVAVVGESGCGASTLARIVAGRERPDRGEVRIDGRTRPDAPPVVAVPHRFSPRWRRARDTIVPRAQRAHAEAHQEMERLLDLVGLEHREERARRLSRGDRQRLAIARALFARPRALVLDDALSFLHTSARERVRDAVVRELRRRGTTTLWATRDTAEAVAVADRVVVLHRGRVAAEGSPEQVYARAAEPAVAAVLGPVNAVPGIVEGAVVDVWGQHVPLAGPAHDGHCEVLVRPQNVVLVASDAPGMDAVVEESTFLGSVRRSLVRTTDGSLVQVDHAIADRLDDHARVRIALAPVPVTTRPLG